MTKIEISLHNGSDNQHIGYIVTSDTMTDDDVGEIANEAGGFSDLLGMGVDGTTVPQDYEWTGDEVFKVLRLGDLAEPVVKAATAADRSAQ